MRRVTDNLRPYRIPKNSKWKSHFLGHHSYLSKIEIGHLSINVVLLSITVEDGIYYFEIPPVSNFKLLLVT
jgi:hypothetical protein